MAQSQPIDEALEERAYKILEQPRLERGNYPAAMGRFEQRTQKFKRISGFEKSVVRKRLVNTPSAFLFLRGQLHFHYRDR